MTSSHCDLHHLITLICHEGKCKKKKILLDLAVPFFFCVGKKKVGSSRTKCLMAGPLPGTSCPPLSLPTLFAALLLPEAARAPPLAFLAAAASRNPGVRTQPGDGLASFALLPEAIML